MKQAVISVLGSVREEDYRLKYTHMVNRDNHLAMHQYLHTCVHMTVCISVYLEHTWQSRSHMETRDNSPYMNLMINRSATEEDGSASGILFCAHYSFVCECMSVFVCLLLSMWRPVMLVMRWVLTQSTMRILLTLSLCWSCLAAMATELKKQKPLWTNRQEERQPHVFIRTSSAD